MIRFRILVWNIVDALLNYAYSMFKQMPFVMATCIDLHKNERENNINRILTMLFYRTYNGHYIILQYDDRPNPDPIFIIRVTKFFVMFSNTDCSHLWLHAQCTLHIERKHNNFIFREKSFVSCSQADWIWFFFEMNVTWKMKAKNCIKKENSLLMKGRYA